MTLHSMYYPSSFTSPLSPRPGFRLQRACFSTAPQADDDSEEGDDPDGLTRQVTQLLQDPLLFTRVLSGIKLRTYQQPVLTAVLNSVLHNKGLSFVVLFPRQSGKNELQAQLETYLLTLFSLQGAEIVKVSPTWKPQSQNAMRRLERILSKNLLTRTLWTKESGYIFRVGQARIFFFSGEPEANIVGATASTLLEVDEAQDVLITKFDKDIAPMAASTNATRVFWGTAWTSQTLLARELRTARLAEAADGIRRTFVLTADQVAAEVPAYGKFVAAQVAKLGRSHSMIKTQYYSEEIDQEGGMFPSARMAAIQGYHPAQTQPEAGQLYALLIDVAGEDESVKELGEAALSNPGRDSTALTIVRIDLHSLADALIRKPTYLVVAHRSWVGIKHTALYGHLNGLITTWQPRCIVIDATGVGAGLASFLSASCPGKVIPFVFSSASKTKLGWDFLNLVDTGRFKEYAPLDETLSRQLTYCQYQVLPGPEKHLKWGVPDGSRDPATGELLHDDYLLSDALAAILDDQDWQLNTPALVVKAADPLKELDHGF